VADEAMGRKLERYFKSDSGKAFANKRLWVRARTTMDFERRCLRLRPVRLGPNTSER
jgi:hypothetical protein